MPPGSGPSAAERSKRDIFGHKKVIHWSTKKGVMKTLPMFKKLVGPRGVFFLWKRKSPSPLSCQAISTINWKIPKKLRLQNERSWGFLQWSWDLLHGTKSLVGLIWVEWIYRGKGRIPWVFVSFVFCSEKVTYIDTGGFSIAQCGWVVPWSHFREEQLEWHGQIQVANRLAVSTGSI